MHRPAGMRWVPERGCKGVGDVESRSARNRSPLASSPSGALHVRADDLVRIGRLREDAEIPVVVEPAVDDADPVSWLASRREIVKDELGLRGALLLRGFEGVDRGVFEAIARTLSPELMPYLDQHTPRTALGGGIYTSTEYPPEGTVPFHSENSKNRRWPMLLMFCCVRPAPLGGETPIADNRRVYERIPRPIRERFAESGVTYVRNYGHGIGVPWQTAFESEDPEAVERRCRELSLHCEWLGSGRLRVRHVAQGVARHPRSGEMLWFNQAHLFHSSQITPDLRAALLQTVGADATPSEALYGDGSPIEDATIEVIAEAYRSAAVRFPWKAGDVLVLDNMLVSHGRLPYRGDRLVLVAMAQPCEAGASDR